jgi:monoamine oxidase
MSAARIVIVGGGLSGLYAAHRLEQHGISDYLLPEARSEPGGRILSARPEGSDLPIDRFDLGPTWFWPDFQPELDALIQALGLARFEQHQAGDILVERSHGSPIQRLPASIGMSGSMRLAGGMDALIDALQRRVDPARIRTGTVVRHIRVEEDHLALDVDGIAGTDTLRAERVLLAVPPRLAASAIRFSPELPPALHAQWNATATWMAPHAKYIAVFDEPFWRRQGLSGTAQSGMGPLAEIHDASMPGASAALFGFFGIPARMRRSVPAETLRVHCRSQLARLFGPKAASPRSEFIKDWSTDPHTATAADQDATGHHCEAPPVTAPEGPWRDRLIGIASEWSPRYPGYVAGAIEAADLAVRRFLAADPSSDAAPTNRPSVRSWT